MLSPAKAMTWSNALCASRMLPVAGARDQHHAASSTSIFSASAIRRS
jgi:hypothetical protein